MITNYLVLVPAFGLQLSDECKERRYGFLPNVESLWENRLIKPIVIMYNEKP